MQTLKMKDAASLQMSSLHRNTRNTRSKLVPPRRVHSAIHKCAPAGSSIRRPFPRGKQLWVTSLHSRKTAPAAAIGGPTTSAAETATRCAEVAQASQTEAGINMGPEKRRQFPRGCVAMHIERYRPASGFLATPSTPNLSGKSRSVQ